MRFFLELLRCHLVELFLSLASNLNLKIEQLDVKTTFLHGYLDETI